MKRLSYSEKARDDLIRLRHFITQKNPVAAQRVGLELVHRIEKLRIFPEMGLLVMPGISTTIRSGALSKFSLRDMAFGSYVVRYSVHAETVLILRIWHQLEERMRGNTDRAGAESDTTQ